MNPLRLIRTSTFQLAWWYMGVFGASALVLIGVVWWTTVGYLEQQTNATIEAEVTGLVEQYRQRGTRGLEALIRERMAMSTGVPTVYLFADRNRQPLAGNLGAWPAGEADAGGWYNFSRVGEDGRRIGVRGQVFVLSDGRHLLVAQDQSRLEATRSLINEAFLWALGGGLVLALLGGFLMSYSVMRRIDAINRASREIMTGRLQSRMPVRGIHDEFDQLAENLNAMLDRIDSLIEGVKSVADNIAHDLRTPLTRLRGRLENLSGRPGLDDDLRGELAAAMTEADHLLTTFRALLRIARIESGTHDREWAAVELRPLLEDAWELYQAVGEEKGITVRLGNASGELRGDRDLLFQAVSNLLDNAIKYSPAGSEVTIDACETDDLASISIADRGPGVPAEERDKVLDRFYRTASVTGIPGSGLGLSLVSAIARHHGGQLILEDNAPGLRATLRLPRAGGQGPAPVPELALAGAGQ
ncbi:MAG: HAMP domain-containing sensor histidine kinase [Gammaproteobacteria bacterium]